jgi:octaheme c-type cytochrome (tetrathionate reductase family)
MFMNSRIQLPTIRQWLAASLLFFGVSALSFSAGMAADHALYEELQGPFDSIEEINEACIGCHNLTESELHSTVHWQWDGKLNVINNYHPNVVSNSKACGSCHIGYGLSKSLTDEIQPAAVDCLACHDTSGEYFFSRFHQDGAECSMCHDDGARALKERVKEEGYHYKNFTLAEMAQQVGETSVASCGSCHFYDGGGDGAKHGDLDSALIHASFEMDVHMSAEGANLSCADCHQTVDHDMAGSLYSFAGPTDEGSVSALDGPRATCVSCHGLSPMKDEKLNEHTDVIACETCHIPSYARNGIATKTHWDWSTAGKLDRKQRPVAEYNDDEQVVYSSQKGDLTYGENLTPVYRWFNGEMNYHSVGMSVDPMQTNEINSPQGSAEDGRSKIYPFHQFESTLPYDTQSNQLLPMHLAGSDRDAFWNGYNWDESLAVASAAVGIDYSGEYDFTPTVMSRVLNHSVAPASMALTCNDCHTPASLLNEVADVYVPGTRQPHWLSVWGVGLAVLTFFGVLIHAILRIVFSYRRK